MAQALNTENLNYSDVPGWADDDHLAAFRAFCASGRRLENLMQDGGGYLGTPPTPDLSRVIDEAVTCVHDIADTGAARSFFERHFVPQKFASDPTPKLLTGYYEPSLKASRHQTSTYCVPLLARPTSLVNLISDADRGQDPDRRTHVLVDANGDETPCPTRREIECDQSVFSPKAIAWLSCPVDAFFLHVEGSGQLVFEDGTEQRVTYDGKNGHPYTSVGQALIADGVFAKGTLTFEKLVAWLKADLERARKVLWRNESYIFFRPLAEHEPNTALGVCQIPLSAGRSLAVDTAFHQIGVPIYIVAPELAVEAPSGEGFRRLMVAHDVGSAIRGPQRGDIFYGSGPDAGARAGQTVHAGTFYMLVPRATSVS